VVGGEDVAAAVEQGHPIPQTSPAPARGPTGSCPVDVLRAVMSTTPGATFGVQPLPDCRAVLPTAGPELTGCVATTVVPSPIVPVAKQHRGEHSGAEHP